MHPYVKTPRQHNQGRLVLVCIAAALCVVSYSLGASHLCMNWSTIDEAQSNQPEKSTSLDSDALVTGSSIEQWETGIQFEINHHRKWTCGEKCWDGAPLVGWLKYERDTKLQGLPVDPHRTNICRVLEKVYGEDSGGKAKIMLDHGAGPFSNLGKRFTCPKEVLDEVDAQVIAVDPLAPLYNQVLNEFSIHNTLRTAYCASENLSNCIGENVVDFSIITNALDHSQNALQGFLEALKATAIGGISCVYSIRNEAAGMNGVGFHRWNFDINQQGHWIISNIESSDAAINVDQLISSFATKVETRDVAPPMGQNQMFVCYQKTSQVPKFMEKIKGEPSL